MREDICYSHNTLSAPDSDIFQLPTPSAALSISVLICILVPIFLHLSYSSVLVLILNYSPVSQNVNHIHLQHQCFPCIPPQTAPSHKAACIEPLFFFLSSVSTPSNMQSCFQTRWIILASELGKQRTRSASHFSFLRLASDFLPDKCPNIKHSRNFKAVFNVLNNIPSFFWLKSL